MDASMMDISDGLATDLRHILKASKVGAEIDSQKVPMVGNIEEALFDGEDFELLFTAPQGFSFQGLEQKFPMIGKITDRPEELLLDGEPLDGKAFEHFK